MALAFAYPTPKPGKKKTFSVSEVVSETRFLDLIGHQAVGDEILK